MATLTHFAKIQLFLSKCRTFPQMLFEQTSHVKKHQHYSFLDAFLFESYRALKRVHFQEDHTGHRFSVFKVLTCKFFRIRKNKLCLYTKGYKSEWTQLESEVRGRQNNPGENRINRLSYLVF